MGTGEGEVNKNEVSKIYLMSKVSIMYRNIVQNTEIGRFEKSDKKQKQKKRDFQASELCSRSKNLSVLDYF